MFVSGIPLRIATKSDKFSEILFDPGNIAIVFFLLIAWANELGMLRASGRD
jgi:hypothetical protein